jgi:hypothetical protein
MPTESMGTRIHPALLGRGIKEPWWRSLRLGLARMVAGRLSFASLGFLMRLRSPNTDTKGVKPGYAGLCRILLNSQ